MINQHLISNQSLMTFFDLVVPPYSVDSPEQGWNSTTRRAQIIGSGDVAQTLSAGFASHGHAVMLGTRDVTKLGDFVAQHKTIEVGTTREAAASTELAALARKGHGNVGYVTAHRR